MRPDLDEYEELNPESGEPRSRAMSWLVLGVAVVGFGALAYYAYQSGSQSVADGQMLVVNAEEGAIKETPADAGGEQFPHKDKTIYDALSPYRTDQKVETLLPTAEEPVIPEPAVGVDTPVEKQKAEAATSYVNNAKVAATEEAESKTAAVSTTAATPAAKTESAPAPAAKSAETAAPAKLETVEVNDSTVATKTVAKTVETPKLVAEAPKAAPKPAPAPAAKPAPAPAAASSGDYKIQLGALGSEAEARTLWGKITAKHGDVVKGSPIIVKADVNGKTYYRLRASGFSSADAAKKACATLSGRGQACMPAGK